MARGSKTCPQCCRKIGVRSYSCKYCQHSFQKPVADTPEPTVGIVRLPSATSEKASPESPKMTKSYFIEITGQDPFEEKARKQYYAKLRTFESECGQYRIRYAKRFQGVKLDKRFRLLVKKDEVWVLPSPPSRFSTYRLAVESYVRRRHGLSPRPVSKTAKRSKHKKTTKMRRSHA